MKIVYIYIWDDINDALAAKNCNMYYIGVKTGKTKEIDFLI